ncbi:MAG: phospholipase D family protein [Gemmatimonadaceae bacterium]|nr:phospholipase D family protein [Gemmatimonadaceae bacterium]
MREVADAGELDLAAPYLSVSILRELVRRAPKFRLVTDAEEWLRAFARPARTEILDFIHEHAQQVRHCRDLHAKVALSPTLAMFGSANFTERGLFQRQEVGAVVSDEGQVRQIREWYDLLWMHASPIVREQLLEFEASLPALPESETTPTLRTIPLAAPETASARAASLIVAEADIDRKADSEDRLIAYLAGAPSRRWTESYFESIATLVEALGVENGDKRFVLTIREGTFFIPVTINSRWVLRPYIADDRTLGIAGAMLLVRANADVVDASAPGRVYDDVQFRAQRGETDEPPMSIAFRDFSFLSDRRFRDEWLIACQVELLRRAGSQNQRHHSRILFRTATDRAYRQRLFARVNWANA